MPTIHDVAQALNLSITTVSRALDGYDDVSAETRQRVIETAQQLGYVPNRAARQLRRQRTDTIGFILPSVNTGFANPFFSEFMTGLGDEVAANNYDLLVSSAAPDSVAEKTLYQRWVQGQKVDGMVINRIRLKDWRLHYLSEQKKPFVSYERSPDDLNFCGVETDVTRGYRTLVNHLADLGHKRIAYIGGPDNLKIETARFEAFQQGLAAAGINIAPEMIIEGDLTLEGGYRSMDGLLTMEQPPTAIVCVNDLTAIGVMHAIQDRDYIVGRDIAVAGFDGIVDSRHTRPPLTTLDQPVYDIARQLVKMLLELLEGKQPDNQIVYPDLIIRASTAGR